MTPIQTPAQTDNGNVDTAQGKRAIGIVGLNGPMNIVGQRFTDPVETPLSWLFNGDGNDMKAQILGGNIDNQVVYAKDLGIDIAKKPMGGISVSPKGYGLVTIATTDGLIADPIKVIADVQGINQYMHGRVIPTELMLVPKAADGGKVLKKLAIVDIDNGVLREINLTAVLDKVFADDYFAQFDNQGNLVVFMPSTDNGPQVYSINANDVPTLFDGDEMDLSVLRLRHNLALPKNCRAMRSAKLGKDGELSVNVGPIQGITVTRVVRYTLQHDMNMGELTNTTPYYADFSVDQKVPEGFRVVGANPTGTALRLLKDDGTEFIEIPTSTFNLERIAEVWKLDNANNALDEVPLDMKDNDDSDIGEIAMDGETGDFGDKGSDPDIDEGDGEEVKADSGFPSDACFQP